MKDNPDVKITTTCPVNIYKAARASGQTFRSLIISGWQASEKFPALLDRINELEEKMTRYKVQLEHTSNELHHLRASTNSSKTTPTSSENKPER